jgi:hypothetical protein
LITALIAAGALPAADTMIYTQVLIIGGRTKAVAIASVAVGCLNLALNLLLVPVLGIEGSAGITFFCYAVGAVRSRWLAGEDGPPTNPRPLLILICGAAVCIASAAVPATGTALVARLLVAAAATLAFFIQLLALARPETYQRLRAQLRSRL